MQPKPVDNAVKKRDGGLLTFTIFIIMFYIVHAAYSYEYAHSSFLQSSLISQIVLRLGLWTLPVLVYLAFSGINPIGYLKLNKNVLSGVLWGVIIGAGILGINMLKVYVLSGQISINLDIDRNFWWKGIILVGLSEEVVFRGFILQKVNEGTGFWVANCINAVLFVLVHVIGWVLLNQFSTFKFRDMAVLFVFAFLQGFVLKKTKSLWACMIIHSFNNFTSVVINI